MELTTVVLTKDVVMEEAGDSMEWVDTAAAVSAITERMQEKLVALDVVELLGDAGVWITRTTQSGSIAYVALCDGLAVCAVRAQREDGEWSVLMDEKPGNFDRLRRGGAAAATCFAACMLLAASTVRDKGGTDGE
jgi:hypothetical protein